MGRQGGLLSLMARNFSFELNHTVAPRYFLVSYKLDNRRYREKVVDADTKELFIEHKD